MNELMVNLGVTTSDLVNKKDVVIEKIFCAAILKHGTDITSSILGDVIKMKKTLYGENNS